MIEVGRYYEVYGRVDEDEVEGVRWKE